MNLGLKGTLEWGTIYIFRGKAATGKSALANILGKKKSILVLSKDDVLIALKESMEISDRGELNHACYNILESIIQRSLDLETSLILDVGLGNRKYAKMFFDKLNFRNNNVVKIYTDCSDNEEWLRRHEERLKNPTLSQSFKSLNHVVEHYNKIDINPLEDEYVIDTSGTIEQSYSFLEEMIKANIH